jgi:uncharacterized protein YcbK (DUF882 family)
MNLKYFKNEEFDDKDLPGSWINMDRKFVELCDLARSKCDFPWKITSGFRTQDTLNRLIAQGYKASPTSEHLDGKAIDVVATTDSQRFQIVSAAMAVGISRIGISTKRGFVHLGFGDSNGSKNANRIWTY